MKLKRLSWAANRADNLICTYSVDITEDKEFTASSTTFQWYPADRFRSKKTAMEFCQRHYASMIYSLFEDTEDAERED
jgi:hypothetical protein